MNYLLGGIECEFMYSFYFLVVAFHLVWVCFWKGFKHEMQLVSLYLIQTTTENVWFLTYFYWRTKCGGPNEHDISFSTRYIRWMAEAKRATVMVMVERVEQKLHHFQRKAKNENNFSIRWMIMSDALMKILISDRIECMFSYAFAWKM